MDNPHKVIRPYYPYWQYTDLFIFRFVSLLCLRSTLGLFKVIKIVFLDFRKAFDLIDHNVLLENCNNIGIRPAVLSWLASYLSGRSQVTRYGNEISNRAVVGGGVPQGSRIGSVAFIVHINGCPGQSNKLIRVQKVIDPMRIGKKLKRMT